MRPQRPRAQPTPFWRAPVATLMLAGVLLWHPPAARADEPASRSPQPQAARHELWLSLSATLLLAGIAGSFALRQGALYDRIALLGPNTGERPRLQEDAVGAERLAWGFGTAASLMAVTSVLLLIYQPSTAAAPETTPVLTPVFSHNQLGVRYRSRF